MHDIAVLNNVVLALDAHLACFADSGLRAILDIVVVLDDLGADKALLKVGVDDTRTLWSLPTLLIRPGLHLHFASGDKGFKVQQGVGLLDKAVDATLLQAQLLQKQLLVLVRLQFGNVLLSLGGNDHHFGTFFLSQLPYPTRKIVAVFGIGLADVADIEHGLGCQQEEIAGCILLVLTVELHDAGVLTLLQHLLVSLQHRYLYLRLLVAGGGSFLGLGQTALNGLEVFQLQFGIDDFLVTNGVDGAVNVSDVLVLEAA